MRERVMYNEDLEYATNVLKKLDNINPTTSRREASKTCRTTGGVLSALY